MIFPNGDVAAIHGFATGTIMVLALMKTESEVLFEQYCDARDIAAESVAVGDAPTPDYRILIDGLEAFVEIKQFDPNGDELDQLEKLQEGEVLVLDGTPGARVRDKIGAAAKQLSIAAKDVCPAILVLYNNQPFLLGNPASPYNVRVAMYGFETVVLARSGGGFSLEVTDRKFGPKKRLTETQNTTISAIAVLSKTDEGLHLAVYHNQHAAQPIPHGLFAARGGSEYVLDKREDGKFQDWRRI